MLCIVVANQDKWTTVLDGKAIGTSKHIDYSIFHFRAHDVAALKKPITKFIWVGGDDVVTEVITTDQLKERNVSYKSAKRDANELTVVEQTEVTAAIELIRAALVAPKPEPVKPPLDFNPGDPAQVEHEPAADAPKVILSADGAANGLGDVLGQADEPEGEATDDPLSTVKPSRATQNKRKRR
jgi:hypothetical protein